MRRPAGSGAGEGGRVKHDPIRVPTASPPELIELAKALARADVRRDIAAARKDQTGANASLRPLL